MYNRNEAEQLQAKKEMAQVHLDAYLGQPENTTAGLNILRNVGLYSYEAGDEFLAWYPRHPSYVILRLAAAGKLKVKP